MLDSGILFPCHGVAGQKRMRGFLPPCFACPANDLGFRAADVGNQRVRQKMRSNLRKQFENCAYRRRQQDEIALRAGCDRITNATINSASGFRLRENPFTIATDDTPAEPVLSDPEGKGTANEPGADDCDLAKRHEGFERSRDPSAGDLKGRKFRSPDNRMARSSDQAIVRPTAGAIMRRASINSE